jgi:uncharacterized protein (TIGR03067 family)
MQRRAKNIMQGLVATLIGLALACVAAAEAAPANLEGTWTASAAERDGKPAEDVVGHRLALAGNRFQIDAKDGKPLYVGTFRTNPSAEPATIDFEHEEGTLNGKVWKGIYALDGDTLTICDNAAGLERDRPRAFEAKAGSGYVLLTFRRARP